MKDSAITTIAREAGVSIATVSRVLNNERGVSDEVRKKTLELMEKNGYQPRKNTRRGTRLAVVMQEKVPNFDGFFAQILTGIFSYASEQNVETTLVHHLGNGSAGDSVVECLRRKRCNGAIFMATARVDADELLDSRIPTVFVANRHPHSSIGFIDGDSYTGALDLMHYLLRLGHRKIGYLSGELEGFVDHQARLAAYLDAMKAAGLSVKQEWVVDHEPGETEQGGYRQLKKLLAGDSEVTAVFCCNDPMAYGAICACVEAGKKVPEDISVVGYDDGALSRYYNPPLTTVRQPLWEMGYEAAKWVDLCLRGKLKALPRKVLHSELIVRRSCAPVQGNIS